MTNNTISFDDWLNDWWKELTFWKKVRYVLLGVWLRHISWPLQDVGYRVWHWIGEKLDWLELVYWELENEDQEELTEEELAAWNKMFDD